MNKILDQDLINKLKELNFNINSIFIQRLSKIYIIRLKQKYF